MTPVTRRKRAGPRTETDHGDPGSRLLWFGWFGFNAGSALATNGSAGLAFFDTQVSGAAGIAGWLLIERLRDGHATTMGAASGAVAVALFSFAATWVIATVLSRTIGFRVTAEHEHGGLDLAVHGESAYDLGVAGAHSGGHASRPASALH